MCQNVMITGAGKVSGLGYNLVLRFLEAGDNVAATIRKPCPELEELKKQYPGKLTVLMMDISSTASVQAAANELSEVFSCLDLLINNAVSVSPDCDKGFFEADLDLIARTVDIAAVGAMRVIKAFYPLLVRSGTTALIMNISSEAGSISKCYRTNLIDYGMAKAALNMATMNLFNTFRDERAVNIFCIHPGWIRTDGRPDNPAPLSSYEAAEILRLLSEKKRFDFEGHRFITNLDEDYPF